MSGLAKVNFGPYERVCNCILWSCFTGENRTKPMQFYTHFCSTTDQQQGRQSTLYYTERRDSRNIRDISQHLRETQSRRTADGDEGGEERHGREREKNQRCHLALNEGKENADRNKLSDSSGPLRETDRWETVCTEVQEDIKQGADGWMDGEGLETEDQTPAEENKSCEFFHPCRMKKAPRV